MEPSKRIELAVASTATVAFLKCLYVLCQYFILDDDDYKPLKAVVKQNTPLAKPFIETFKLDATLFGKCMKAAGAGSEITDELDEQVYDFADTTKEVMDKFQKDTTISQSNLDILLDLLRWLMTESDTVLKRLEKKVSSLGDPTLTQSFMKDTPGKQGPILTKLRKLIKLLTGVSEPTIPVEKREAIKNKNPEKYKEFLKLRGELTAIYRDALRNLVRGSGKPFIPYADVIQYMKSQGITHNLPIGFVGNVDEEGKLYTTAGKPINGVPNGATVKMNPKYNAEQDNAYVFESVPGTGFNKNAGRYYTFDYQAKKSGSKFEKVGDFIEEVDALSVKWSQMMKGSDRKSLLALMLETMYLTQMRVSSKEGLAKGQTTYGLTTLLCKHVKKLQGKIRFMYPGKDGVDQVHDITPVTPAKKVVISKVLALKKGRKADDRLWSMNDKPVNYNELRAFWVTQAPPGVSMHKVRHVEGTRASRKILDDSPLLKKKAVTQTEADAWVKAAITKVGAQLGHMQGKKVTPMTAIKNYIDPQLFIDFYGKLNLRVPKWVPVKKEAA